MATNDLDQSRMQIAALTSEVTRLQLVEQQLLGLLRENRIADYRRRCDHPVENSPPGALTDCGVCRKCRARREGADEHE